LQAIFATLAQELLRHGASPDEIAIYMRGAHDGIRALIEHLKTNKMSIDRGETDPLYIHTWNFVIERLADKVNIALADTFREEGLVDDPKRRGR
jgi:hypothetical protein